MTRDRTLRSGENRVLELIARGAPLPEILDAIVRVIEGESPGLVGSILLLDHAGKHLRHGAAPSLPMAYTGAIDGTAIGPAVGSCGTAAYRRAPVIVTDIAADPLWRDFRDLALRHDLRACWSTPISDAAGTVLGTFALYYREPRGPTRKERELVAVATHLACIAIEGRRREEARQASEERFRLAAWATHDAIWDVDHEHGTWTWSDPHRRFGYAPEVIPANEWDFWPDRIHPADRARVIDSYRRFEASREISWSCEYRFRRADGMYEDVYDRCTAVRNSAGQVRRVVGSMMLQTDRKRADEARRRAEAALHDSREELRRLAVQQDRAREGERAHIGREIHDALGQTLTALKLDLAWLEEALPADRPDLRDKLHDMGALLGETMRTVREISAELRPVVLDQLGLAPAVEWLAHDFQRRTGIPCEVRAVLSDDLVDREAATGIFRICQEALTNVARHAGATAVRIVLHHADRVVRLEVLDNGRGIAGTPPDANTVGLVGMRERALALGGLVEILPASDGGTQLTAWVPAAPALREVS